MTSFALVLKLVTLNYLEQCNGHYFALFNRIWYIGGPVTSWWLKINLYCLRLICSPKNLFFLAVYDTIVRLRRKVC